MKVIMKLSDFLTNALKWVGMITLVVMMVFIFSGVVMRQMGSPVLGSVEIVQFLMVITIMCGLPYTESQNGHIAVELFFEKFHKKVQSFILLFVNLLSLACISFISFVYFRVAYNSFVNGSYTSELLAVPFFPFEAVIAICFAIWFLELLKKSLVRAIGG